MSNKQILAGKNVQKARKRLGWTQEQLAAEAEISVQYLSQIERGMKNPSMNTLLRLARSMNISMDILAGNHVSSRNTGEPEIEYLMNGLNPYEKRVVLDFLQLLVQALQENRKLLKSFQDESETL